MTSQTWPQGGYAPGSYWSFCLTCRQKFTGDKRAYHCPDCVIQAQAAEVARLTAERDALLGSAREFQRLANEAGEVMMRAVAERDALRTVVSECRRHVSENLIRMYGHDGFGEIRRIDALLINSTSRDETAV